MNRSLHIHHPAPAGAARGFTLVELLIALGVLALMAGLSWRGLDAMLQTSHLVGQRSDAVLTLQTSLAQWSADLDAALALPDTPPVAWDGRSLRLTRRSTTGEGMQVVAWTRRGEAAAAGRWLRWQSPPLRTRGELRSAWEQAARWAQGAGEEERRLQVELVPLEQWQIYFYRNNAWSNPLSSADAGASAQTAAAGQSLPDGVRLVLTLPANHALGGTITRDWLRTSVGGARS